MREIVFDTETTGLDHASGDRIVEIGCIELIHRVPSGKSIHFYFCPDRPMPPGAEAVHGLSDAFLADKPRFHEKAAELLDFLGDCPLVAHNAAFDFGFLNAELTIAGLESVCTSRMVDTVAMARKRHPGAKHSLDALCTRYGIDRSHRVKHGALLDAELLAQVYIELTGGKQIGLAFAGAAAEATSTVAAAAPIRIRREPRPHMANAEELARHQAFMKTIVSPIWAT